jgi:hypothetical protein
MVSSIWYIIVGLYVHGGLNGCVAWCFELMQDVA